MATATFEDWLKVDDRPYIGELLEQVLAETEEPLPWHATGLGSLDRLLDGGVRPGEMFVVAARPSVGKSAFALQLALHAAERGSPVAIWSLEMNPKQWVRRALSSIAGVSHSRLRRGEVGDMEYEMLESAARSMARLPLWFASTKYTVPSLLAEEIEMQVAARDVKLCLIDYLSLLQSEEHYSREQEVAEHCRNLKRIANASSATVIALAQLNRDSEGKVPTLANLRESGEIEASADEVFFLHRAKDPDTQLLLPEGLGILAKNRDGATGAFPLRYDWRSFRFVESQ